LNLLLVKVPRFKAASHELDDMKTSMQILTALCGFGFLLSGCANEGEPTTTTTTTTTSENSRAIGTAQTPGRMVPAGDQAYQTGQMTGPR
jgi:hypothetical protein